MSVGAGSKTENAFMYRVNQYDPQSVPVSIMNHAVYDISHGHRVGLGDERVSLNRQDDMRRKRLTGNPSYGSEGAGFWDDLNSAISGIGSTIGNVVKTGSDVFNKVAPVLAPLML